MAMTKQSVTITRPDAGTVQIAIGNETHTLPMSLLTKRRDGIRDVEDLLFQFEIALQASGVNPKTATLAQIKNAIESQTYWWGNI